MRCAGQRSAFPHHRNRGKQVFRQLAGSTLLIVALNSHAQIPTATVIGLPAEPLINEPFCFDVNFTNGVPITGYGPYVIGSVDAFIEISSATFVDVPPRIDKIGDFDATGQLIDPISGITINGNQGGAAYDIRYPVGSMESSASPLDLEVCGTVTAGAEVNVPLDATFIPGFEFGDIPTAGGTPIVGAAVSNTVTPRLARVEKTNSAPEGERPPGPSHAFEYRYNVNISDAIQLDNFVLEDILPPEIQWTGVAPTITAPLGVGCAVSQSPNFPPTAGGTLTIECTAVAGTTATADMTVALPVYITDVLDETRPDSQTITNTVNMSYEYQNVPYSAVDTSDVLAVHAAIQKSSVVQSSPNILPGEVLEYTINFQVTNYPGTPGSGADQFVITDIIPDGLLFTGTLDLVVGGASYAITPTITPSGDDTMVVWDIADAAGGIVPDAGDGYLTYRARILNTYADGSPVEDNDPLDNSATLDYQLTDGGSGNNGSGSLSTIEPAVPEKDIASPSPLPSELAPGDEVIFRLSMEVPTGNANAVTFVDILPRPVFDVVSFDPNVDILDPGAGFLYIPLDPSDPAQVSIDASQNSITLNYGDLRVSPGDILAVDLRLRISTEPFADNLFLTNLMTSEYTNSNGDTFREVDAAAITVGAPALSITKGAIAVDNPNGTFDVPPPANPGTELADSNVANVDAADVVTFLLTVENIGGQSAYNVTVTDPAVSSMDCDLGSIEVRDGTNVTTLPFTGDLHSGLVLTNPLAGNDDSPAGGGAPFSTDTALISYDCTLASDVIAGSTYTNTASVIWDAVVSGATPFPPQTDDATVEIAIPTLAKELVAVVPGYSSATRSAHIGEELIYRLVITLPEGSIPNARLLDTLDEGLAFIDANDFAVTGGITTDIPGSFSAILTNAGFNPVGSGDTAPDRRLAFGPANNQNGFGNLDNANTDNSTADTITLIYRARVLNAPGNVSGLKRRNRAVFSWERASGQRQTVARRAAQLTIVEASLNVAKSITPPLGDNTTPPQVTLTLSHGGGSTADAFDTIFQDSLPFPMEIASIDTSGCASTPPNLLIATPGDTIVEARWDTFPQGATCTLVINAVINSVLPAGADLHNCATGYWESLLDSDPALDSPPNNILGVERTGNPADVGGNANTYLVEGCADFQIFDLAITKTVIATSQTQTDSIPGTPAGAESLTIGEEVTFELVLDVPEAPTVDVRVQDRLPTSNMKLEVISAVTTSVGADLTPGTPDPVPVLSDADSDGLNDTIAMDYGSVSHVLDGVTDDRDRIRVELVAVVRDVVENHNNAVGTNTGVVNFRTFPTLPDKTATDTADIEVVEPFLQLGKVGDRTEAEAGDTINYTLAISHIPASRVDAEDVVLSDTLPPELNLVPGSAIASAACASMPDSLSESGDSLSASWSSFPLGGYCEIEFQATVNIGAITGSIVTNQANLDWTSLAGTGDSDDRSYTAPGRWNFTVSSAGLAKEVVNTSNPGTVTPPPGSGATNLTIGEEVTFEITASFADGTTQDVVVQDSLALLPKTVALQVIDSEIISIGSDLSVPGGAVGDPGGACTAPSTDCVAWNLGDITNLPDALPAPGPQDQMVFEVTAIVLDDAENVGLGISDKNLNNTALLNSSNGLFSAIAPYNLVEPQLDLLKLTDSGSQIGPTRAGEVHTFSITIRHTSDSTAAAENLELVDTLGAQAQWVDDTSVQSDCPGFSIVSSPAPGTSGDVEFHIPALPHFTRECQIEYDVIMRPDLPIVGLFRNDVALTYESSVGSLESRDYGNHAIALLFSFPEAAVNKSVLATSVPATGTGMHNPVNPDVAIGEIVAFQVVSSFTEGTTSGVVLVDELQQDAAGHLELIGGAISAVGRNITAVASAPVVSGNTITVDLGTVVNLADGVKDDGDEIVYEVFARVVDLPVNQDGDTLTNLAEMDFQLTPGGIVERVTGFSVVDVVVPELAMTKLFGAIVNTEVIVDLELTNIGTGPTFDLDISDEFDATLWVPGSLRPISVPNGFMLSESLSGGVITVSLEEDGTILRPAPSLRPREILHLAFSLQLQNNGNLAVPQIDNIALAVGNSLPVPNAQGRTVSASATDTLLFPNLALEKTWTGPNSPAMPGDLLNYTLTLTNSGGGELTNVVVEDTPDPLAEFQVGTVITAGGGTVTSGNSPGDTSIAVEFASIGAGETRSILYSVRVPLPYPSGMAAPQALQNQAVAQSNELADVLSDDPNTPALADPTIVPIEADPIMTVSKNHRMLVSPPGSILIYDIVYGNAGDQDATGVVLTETVPANTTFNAASSDPGWSCAGGGAAGATCTLSVGDLGGFSLGNTVFAVTVDNPVPALVARIFNTVTVAEDGIEFTGPSTPSTDTDDEATFLFAQPDLVVDKDDGGISVVPGQSYFYGIHVQNQGNQQSTGIVVTEIVPNDVVFSSASSGTSLWSCADGSAPGTLCTLNLGDLQGGFGTSVMFGLEVIDPAASGADLILNTVSIEDDGSNSPLPQQDSAMDDTPLLAEPDLVINKTTSATNVTENALIVYELNFSNVGNQPATNVVIDEAVPEHTEFSAADSTPGWSCPDASPARTLCTFDVGTLNVNANGTVLFAVTVVDRPSQSVASILNVTVIRDDGANGPDPTPANNTDNATVNFRLLKVPALNIYALALLIIMAGILGSRYAGLAVSRRSRS